MSAPLRVLALTLAGVLLLLAVLLGVGWQSQQARQQARQHQLDAYLLGHLRSTVEDYLAAAWGRPTVSGAGHQGATLPLPSAAASSEDPVGRMISLAAFFGLAALGVWRWRRNSGRHPGEGRGPAPVLDSGLRRNDH